MIGPVCNPVPSAPDKNACEFAALKLRQIACESAGRDRGSIFATKLPRSPAYSQSYRQNSRLKGTFDRPVRADQA